MISHLFNVQGNSQPPSATLERPMLTTLRVRKHASCQIRKGDSLRLRKFSETIKIRRIKNLVIQKVPTEPKALLKPLTITRPQTLVIQRVPTAPRTPLEPSIKAELPLSIRPYPSTSWYSIPTQDTTKFWRSAHPTIGPIEHVAPPIRDDETSSERVEHAVVTAKAKRIYREAWVARTVGMKLAVGLLFSPRSRTGIAKLRKKYEPERKTPWGNFNVLSRLHIDKYAEYENMLTRVAERWKPFVVGFKPGCMVQHEIFRVGLQLESESLGLLLRDLQRDMRNIHPYRRVSRMMRSLEQSSLMVINGNITGFEDALRLEEQLEEEYKDVIEDLRVEGLVLHGRQGNLDCLFPTPKAFRFSGGEVASQKIVSLAGVDAVV